MKYAIYFILLILILVLITGCDKQDILVKCETNLDNCIKLRDDYKQDSENYLSQYITIKTTLEKDKVYYETKIADLTQSNKELSFNLETCKQERDKCNGALEELKTIKSYIWAGLLFQLLFNIGFLFIDKSIGEIMKNKPVFFSLIGITLLFISVLVYFFLKF